MARSYAGVDISARAVERARARGLAAQEIDELAALPFPGASFDAVVCVEVLEHLLFPMEAVRELGRVLRPNGVFIATVPNMAYWRRRLDIAVFGQFHPLGTAEGARRPWQDPHLRFFTRRSFRRLFVEAGFACRVVGDSMLPDYREGDIVVFSPAKPIKSGMDCFARLEPDHESTFKRIYIEPSDAAPDAARKALRDMFMTLWSFGCWSGRFEPCGLRPIG